MTRAWTPAGKVLLSSPRVSAATLREATGWELTPEGACRGDLCVPLQEQEAAVLATTAGDQPVVDLQALADALHLAFVADPDEGLWALGSRWGGKALESTRFPYMVLPDVWGGTYDLGTLRGTRVLLIAWATW